VSDRINLFQNIRNWEQIKTQVGNLVDQDYQSGLAQNTPLVKKLEKRLAELYNRKHCITTASCTDALVIAMQALGLPKDTLVAVSNYTFTATAHAVARAGYRVVPTDIVTNYCIDPNIKNVGAVVAVDMFGNMSDWEKLEQLNIPVINDAAQSLESHNGIKWSAGYGLISCLSFSPSKTISSWGSGGALLTNNDRIAELAKKLRLHGKTGNESMAIHPGLNSMISGFEAACIWAGLDHSEAWQQRRDQINRYLIGSTAMPSATDLLLAQHTHQKLVFQSFDRTEIMRTLDNNKIDSTIHYQRLINDEELYHFGQTLPVSNLFKQYSFTVPNQHTLTDEEVERIAKALQ
jgi:UDP-2-acetamido-2-deoxy-ribo-hexuluronate aminotransferase